MLEALPDQRRAMNVDLGDLDFFEVTDEMSEIIGKTNPPGKKTPHLLRGLDNVGRTRQVKNIFRGIVAASSHDRKGKEKCHGPERLC